MLLNNLGESGGECSFDDIGPSRTKYRALSLFPPNLASNIQNVGLGVIGNFASNGLGDYNLPPDSYDKARIRQLLQILSLRHAAVSMRLIIQPPLVSHYSASAGAHLHWAYSSCIR